MPKESANEALEEVTNSLGKIAKSIKMRDNKVKDYLVGANEKFTSPKANCVNCLLICLSSEEMGHFCDYILNEYTGLFSEKPFITPELFQNVECIILSNCVEAHLDPTLGFNSWDGAEYVNFVIPNHCLKVVPEKIDFLQALFKDRFMDYAKDRDSYMRIDDSGPLGDYYGFCEYLARKFPQFQMNKNCRVY